MIISSVHTNEAVLSAVKPVAAPFVNSANSDPAAQAAALGKTFYFSPALVIDPKSGTDVLEYRNASTGAVTGQYPSEKDLKAYSQHSLKQDDASSTDQSGVSDQAISQTAASSLAAVSLKTADTTTEKPASTDKTTTIEPIIV